MISYHEICAQEAVLSPEDCKALRESYGLDNVVKAEARQPSGYTETEEDCKGCMGPCGMCEESVIQDARELEEIDWGKRCEQRKNCISGIEAGRT